MSPELTAIAIMVAFAAAFLALVLVSNYVATRNSDAIDASNVLTGGDES